MHAQNKSWLGALAMAIRAFCGLLVDIFSVAGEATAMADAAVKVAREKQAVELTIDLSQYAEIAILKASKAQAEARRDLISFIGTDEKLLAEVNQTRKTLSELVGAEIAHIRASRGTSSS